MTLLLGPALRHTDETTAVIWVQADRPGTVEVLGCTARTFEVQGFHFGLVVVTGLAPDSCREYQVRFDGELVWPEPHSPFPPSVIRTRGPDRADRLDVVFGSCRYPKTGDPKIDAALGLDALDCYAARMAGRPVEAWPDALILLGDQVYADELTPEARRNLAGSRHRRGRGRGLHHQQRPPDEVVSFAEYVRLYQGTWSDQEIRWVMSTVPTAMIFDDHDIRDDWNTSAAWRAEMAGTPWWPDRIRAGLASYWVYQHLGNLSPAELDSDEDYQRVVGGTGDRWPVLAELADRADRELDGAKGVRFSFRWDLGRSRLVMIDSRNGRILESGQRKMLGDTEFDWVQEQAERDASEVDHLILGSSLPWLMPYAIGDLQSVNERAAARPGRRGRLGEKIRQAADLEHWAAFARSFTRLSTMITAIATRADAPATVSVLSGDVHHSYAARALLPGSPRSGVFQLVCSPVHNHVPVYIRPGFLIGWSRRLAALTRWWARRQNVPDLPMRWRKVCGPLFGNTVATLRTDGRRAHVVFEQPRDSAHLDEVARLRLA